MRTTRFAATAAAVVIFSITSSQSAPTVVSASSETFPFSLTPGACRAITIPLLNKPVRLIGAANGLGYEGVAELTVLSTSNVLSWVGADLLTGTVLAEKSVTPGRHITWLDGAGYVDVQVRTRRGIQICNAANSTINPATGSVTFFW